MADLFEIVADAVPDREAVVVGERRLTYSQLEERANRLANHLASEGIGAGDHVGLQLMNGSEYVEGMLAAFKLRAIPINVNYRYVEGELRYLYEDAGLTALLYHRSFGPRVEAAASTSIRVRLVIEDESTARPATHSTGYEDALLSSRPDRPAVPRSSDDLYIVYTGGTTGMPKGVVWRHEDIFKAAMGGGDVTQSGNFIQRPEELAERITPTPAPTALATPPLIHNSAHWLAFYQLFSTGKLVLVPLGAFDPPRIWELVGQEQVFTLVLVGDAMARPLADELGAHPERYDTNSLWVIGSGGAILSQSAKERLLELLPNRMIVDAFGSSETGVVGNRESPAGSTFVVNEMTAVLDEDGNRVEPGSGVIGRLARRGHVPLRYHNDPEKSARTFLELDEARWVLPGDMATVEADGAITLLGRGSLSINTGGEKVFPEEVERPLRDHPDVADAVVVGIPDERWGERVVAVVQPAPRATPSLEDLKSFCRDRIAGYKLPRRLILVDAIVRSPAGKPDYRWARDRAMAADQAPQEVPG
ncbi:MAG TPA: acyl-CoA synthetase [Actinomycetota bacterium]|nr:acyl-CoA synthetase [Actinomycetota bacterium]